MLLAAMCNNDNDIIPTCQRTPKIVSKPPTPSIHSSYKKDLVFKPQTSKVPSSRPPTPKKCLADNRILLSNGRPPTSKRNVSNSSDLYNNNITPRPPTPSIHTSSYERDLVPIQHLFKAINYHFYDENKYKTSFNTSWESEPDHIKSYKLFREEWMTVYAPCLLFVTKDEKEVYISQSQVDEYNKLYDVVNTEFWEEISGPLIETKSFDFSNNIDAKVSKHSACAILCAIAYEKSVRGIKEEHEELKQEVNKVTIPIANIISPTPRSLLLKQAEDDGDDALRTKLLLQEIREKHSQPNYLEDEDWYKKIPITTQNFSDLGTSPEEYKKIENRVWEMVSVS